MKSMLSPAGFRLFHCRHHIGRTAGALVLMGCVLVASGCRPSSPAAKNKGGQDPNSAAADTDEELRASELIDSVLQTLQPDRLGISSKGETAIALLNEWAGTSTAAASKPKPNPDARQILETVLTAEEIKRAESERFVDRDGRFIRDSLWCKLIANVVIERADTDLERIVELFDFTIRNVAIVEPREDDLPTMPFGICMFGRGTAADRTWVFAELLRQLRFDSVILRPKPAGNADDQAGKPKTWLVGVLLGDNVYLFDPHLGLPIPAAAEVNAKSDPLIQQPATLQDVLDDGTLLTSLATGDGQPYPITRDELKSPVVELIGNTGTWSRRMQHLQNSLFGERSVIVYDGLEDSQQGKGLLERVAGQEGAVWQREDIHVWSYPEENLESRKSLTADQLERQRALQNSFRAPVPIVNIELDTIEITYGPPMGTMLKARTSQVCGNFAEAVGSYVKIRVWGDIPPLPRGLVIVDESMSLLKSRILPEYRTMHEQAAENAYFWTGVCQYEQGNFGACARTLEKYIEQEAEGVWVPAAIYLSAISLVRQGEVADGVAMLEKTPAESLQARGNQLLQRRWQAILAKAEQPADEKPAE